MHVYKNNHSSKTVLSFSTILSQLSRDLDDVRTALLWSALFHHMQMFMHQNIWDWQLTDLFPKKREEITYLAMLDSKSV